MTIEVEDKKLVDRGRLTVLDHPEVRRIGAKYGDPEERGSLEVGKFADLLILDRDYFTIPVDDILKIHPLITMVGGKMTVLQASLANDFGVQPVGPVYDFKDEDVDTSGCPLQR